MWVEVNNSIRSMIYLHVLVVLDYEWQKGDFYPLKQLNGGIRERVGKG